MKDILDKINSLTYLDEKTREQRLIKLGEEYGELCQAFLSYTNASACGYKKKGMADVAEEIADVFIMITSIAFDLGLSNKQLLFFVDDKLKKWENKIKEDAK